MKIDKFKNKKNDINNEILANKKVLNRFINFRLITIILLIIFILYAINNDNKILFVSLSIISFILSVVLSVIISFYSNIDKKLNYKIEVINSYLNRFDDKFKKDKETGLEFSNKEYFEQDLDILGKSSLYTYINFARTPYGKKAVFESLSAKLRSKEEILKRQNIVKDLTNNFDSLIDIEAASFEYAKLNPTIKLENIETGLNYLENVYKPNVFKIIISVLFFISLVVVVTLSSLKYIPTYSPFIVIFIGFFLSMFINPEAHSLSEGMSNCKNILYGYDELIDEINKLNTTDEYLNKLKEPILKLKSKTVKTFNIISSLSESRKNILFQIISNGLFMMDSYIILAYYKWQSKYKNSIREALESIGEIENFISLSTINLVKENSVIPSISDNFEFENIRHPLIEENKCIPNSFVFKGRNIITGSNMSGKTTFMRSIGTNYVLFLAGSSVCATMFSAPILKLFTSMKVVDDVNNNISTFYGEILRIKAICDYTKENKPMLVLVDEIFKGTNTKDRITGASAAIEKLNRKNIYSIVTTHDPELCKIDNVSNYHFLEHYENDEIKFDYKIHDGISTTRNAIYLLKIAGIIDE